MKKLLSFRILLFVFFVGSMFSACNKTEKLSPEATNGNNARTEGITLGENTAEKLPKVKAVDGRLYFANTEEFFATVRSLQNRNEGDYEQFEKNVGFSSLRTLNKKLTKDSSQVKFKDFNFPPHFTTLLNQDGEVQIGDTLMLYHANTQYFVLKNKESAINALRKGQLSDADLKNVVLLKREIKPFERKEVKIASNGRTETALPWYIGPNVGLAQWHEYDYGGHRYRISFELGHFYSAGLLGFSYSELYTKIQVEYQYCNFWGCYFTPAGENADKILSVLNVTGFGRSGNFNYSGSALTGQILNSSQQFYKVISSTNYASLCPGAYGNKCEYIIYTWTSDYACRVFPHYYGSSIPFGTGLGYFRTNLQL